MAGVSTLLVKLSAIDGVTPVLGTAGTAGTTFAGKLKAAGMVGGLALAGVAVAGVKMASEFDTSMREVLTLTDWSATQFDEYKGKVQDLAEVVPKTTEDLAGGLYQVVSAGFAGADAMSILKVGADLATAGMTDTNTAVDAITTALNAYGMEASEASTVSDMMFATVKLGKITMEELAAGMAKATSVGATLGVGFNEIMAATATLTKAGVSSDVAFEGLRTTMLGLVKGNADLSEALKGSGYESGAAMLKAEGLKGTLDYLWQAAGKDATAFQKLVPEMSAFNTAVVLADKGAADFGSNIDGVTNSMGDTKEASDKVKESLASQLTMGWNTVKNALIDFGNAVMPMVTSALDMLGPVISALGATLGFLGDNIGVVKGAAIAFLAVWGGMKVIKLTGGLVDGAVSAFRALTGILSSSAGPIAKTTAMWADMGTKTAATGTSAATMGSKIAGMAGPIAIGTVAAAGLAYAMYDSFTSTSKARNALIEAATAANEQATSLDALRGVTAGLTQGTQEYVDALNAQKAAAEEVVETAGEQFVVYDEFGQVVDANTDAIHALAAANGELDSKVGDLMTSEKGLSETVTTSLSLMDEYKAKAAGQLTIRDGLLAKQAELAAQGKSLSTDEEGQLVNAVKNYDMYAKSGAAAFDKMKQTVTEFGEHLRGSEGPVVVSGEEMSTMLLLLNDTRDEMNVLGLDMFQQIVNAQIAKNPEMTGNMQTVMDSLQAAIQAPDFGAITTDKIMGMAQAISDSTGVPVAEVTALLQMMAGAAGATPLTTQPVKAPGYDRAGLFDIFAQMSAAARGVSIRVPLVHAGMHGGGPVLHGGGPVPSFQHGGYSKERLALLEQGEFVMQQAAVQKYGLPFMESINEGKTTTFTPTASPSGGVNITITAGAYLGTPGDARRMAQKIIPYLDSERAR